MASHLVKSALFLVYDCVGFRAGPSSEDSSSVEWLVTCKTMTRQHCTFIYIQNTGTVIASSSHTHTDTHTHTHSWRGMGGGLALMKNTCRCFLYSSGAAPEDEGLITTQWKSSCNPIWGFREQMKMRNVISLLMLLLVVWETFKMNFRFNSSPFPLSKPLILPEGRGALEPIPADIRQRPVHLRAHMETGNHSLTFTPTGNLDIN